MGVFLNSSLRDSSKAKTKRTCQEMASLIEAVEAVEAAEAAEAAVATREVEEATEVTATQTEVTRKIFKRLLQASTGPVSGEAGEAETARLRSEGQPRNTAR